MTTLVWIVVSSLAMSAIALVGVVTLLLRPETLSRVLLPLVAFAAGTLLGGAFLHLVPAALAATGSAAGVFLWVLAGFVVFFALEQFLHWRHCHRDVVDARHPMTYLVLFGDGLHNFLDGLAIAGAFIADVRLGMGAWLAAAAHEVPQELGDFSVLVHGGWPKGRALVFNLLSGLTFLLGALLAYGASARVSVTFLLPFAAGNFIYIAASDLIPEVRRQTGTTASLVHLAALTGGIALLYLLRLVLGD
ncbi:MAG TPA: ZIP family metal transporter [Longimicrobiales bacterium]|nr:ZIP family metal transporter [Longimicrobiales bacterium]